VNLWIDKTVMLNDSWGPGATAVLKAPNGGLAEFTLRARSLRDSQGRRQPAQLVAEIASGFLGDGWIGAVFTPMGTEPVTGLAGLAPWDPTQAAAYRKAIEGGSTNIGNSTTMRLEGVIPFLGAGGVVGYDVVRLYYAVSAVKGPLPDLVVVKTATHTGIPGTVRAQQDGAGHGPPK
jgi:hypothetical protein